MAFIHTLRNRPFVVCFLPSSNYPPETKFSRPNSTPHSQTSSDNKNKRRRNPPPKTKQKKNLTKHPNTVQPRSPLPFPSCSHLLPPNYKTQNLILMLPNNNNNNNNKDTNWWIQFPVMLMILQSSTKNPSAQHNTKQNLMMLDLCVCVCVSLSLKSLFLSGTKAFFCGFPLMRWENKFLDS